MIAKSFGIITKNQTGVSVEKKIKHGAEKNPQRDPLVFAHRLEA